MLQCLLYKELRNKSIEIKIKELVKGNRPLRGEEGNI